MYLKIEVCPVCKTSNFKNYIIAKDNLITQESFALSQCNSCSFIFTNPRPTDEQLDKYYQSPNYDSHKKDIFSLKDGIYKVVRKMAVAEKLTYINTLTEEKVLLDIGCGTGYFISHCSKNGWDSEGMEPNIEFITPINSNIKIFKTLESIRKNAYNIITFWHSLEHIPHLDQVLDTSKAALQKKGKLIIAVPNINSFDAQYYKEHWAAIDVPRHLYHFTQETMAKLLKSHGFKIDKVSPMKYDAYYVSLLSEKYKTGKTNYFTAYKIGKQSNDWAKVNNNNYSSLMYTISKK